MVTYKPTVHKSWLRTSRLGTARKNYANAYNDYQSIWDDTKRVKWYNSSTNSDYGVIKARIRKDNALKNLKAETQMAKDYYKKVKGNR